MNGVKCLKFFCVTALFILITAASGNFEATAGELELPANDFVKEPYAQDQWIDATGNFHEAAQKLVEEFEPGRTYTEREVNQILVDLHDDVATLRRDLIGHGLMQRDSGLYWRVSAPGQGE